MTQIRSEEERRKPAKPEPASQPKTSFQRGDIDSDSLSFSRFHSSLEPYESLIAEASALIRQHARQPTIENSPHLQWRGFILSLIQQLSQADAVIGLKFREDSGWTSILQSGHSLVEQYRDDLLHAVLPRLPEREIFSRDSHGIVVDHPEGKGPILLVPIGVVGNRKDQESIAIAICNVGSDPRFFSNPFGRIISILYNLTEQETGDFERAEAKILDGLKESYQFVSPNLYNRRFKLFCKRLQQMTVHFQPILRLQPMVIDAWEALARDPETGRAPADLFHAAELWGIRFTTELDLYFLRCSTRIYREQRAEIEKQRFDEFLPLSVNVYPESLMRTAYIDAVDEIVSNQVIPQGKLILEISEKSELPKPVYWNEFESTWEAFRDRLREYARRKTGVRFAIDDFGVGHASVSRLLGLSLEYVKIDREVLTYNDRVRDRVITFVREALIEANHLTPHVIVEGVDTDYPIGLHSLCKIGAQSIQGYLVSHPAREIFDRLDRDKALSLEKQLASA